MSLRITTRIHGGKTHPVWFRRPQPLSAPRVRYTGFRPGSEILKKGQVRREGAQPLSCDILLERDVPVVLRDGTVIYTDVFRPLGQGRHPAIVSWSPYGKQVGGQWLDDMPERFGVKLEQTTELMKWEGVDPGYWVAQGYAVLHPDIRGAYRSGGNLVLWGGQLAEDGYDFIEWAAARDWCNGKLGMAGNSFLTVSQWFIAALRPPHLAAIAPWEGVSDLMRDDFLRGGVPRTGFMDQLIQTFAGETWLEDITKMAVEEPDETAYWRDKIADLERIQVPAYIVASYDSPVHTQGTFQGWRRIGSQQKWLRVHNTQEWPDLYDPRNVAELQRFFDRFLKGEDNGWERTPQVRISVLDPGRDDEVNRVVASFPPPGYPHRALYLQPRGGLGEQLPSAPTHLDYDAQNGSATFHLDIDREAELIGYLRLRLWVQAEGNDDMDLAVLVEKVDGDGKQLIRSTFPGHAGPTQATGFLRVSRRALDPRRSTPAEPYLTMRGEQLLQPGQIVPVDIAIWPIALKLHPGEQLRLTVSPASNAPMPMPFGRAPVPVPIGAFTFDPASPPQRVALGGEASTSPAWVGQQQVLPPTRNRGVHRLYFGGDYDSHLLLPLKYL